MPKSGAAQKARTRCAEPAISVEERFLHLRSARSLIAGLSRIKIGLISL
jgi:hypothetical protein